MSYQLPPVLKITTNARLNITLAEFSKRAKLKGTQDPCNPPQQPFFLLSTENNNNQKPLFPIVIAKSGSAGIFDSLNYTPSPS